MLGQTVGELVANALVIERPAAVAAPQPVWVEEEESEKKRTRRHFQHQVVLWSRGVGIADPPQLWACMPNGSERSTTFDLFVPIESTVYSAVGAAEVARPRTWAFLPLTAVWTRIGLADAPLPTDHAETEVMA